MERGWDVAEVGEVVGDAGLFEGAGESDEGDVKAVGDDGERVEVVENLPE